MNAAVFLDKDGTLVEDIPYNVDPNVIQLSGFSLEGLKGLQNAGYLLVIVTNQAGVALGYFMEEQLKPVEQKIKGLYQSFDIDIAGFYYCPHHPDGNVAAYTINCDCRKPNPGLIKKAALELNIDLQRSWMIGDILNDVEAGSRAGCKTILLDIGNETEWLKGEYRTPDKSVKSINEAASYILLKSYHGR
jgi:D,D-heptose 1,7-bisphosphate phosphatase